MQKLKRDFLIAILGYSLGLISSKIYSKLHFKTAKKKGLVDLIGNTPLIYLKSLSKLCGCEIYVILFKILIFAGESGVFESNRKQQR
jgi:hypothetical protein